MTNAEKIGGALSGISHGICEAFEQEVSRLRAERDRYLSLLREIATAEDHAEEKSDITTEYTLSAESIQRHVRQQLGMDVPVEHPHPAGPCGSHQGENK